MRGPRDRKTQRGTGFDKKRADAAALSDPNKTGAHRPRELTSPQDAMGFDVRMVHDSDEPWRALELWTARSIYWLDNNRICVAVITRQTKALDPSSPFVGAKLLGGQHSAGGQTSIARPFPLQGMVGMFQAKTGGLMTAAVEQVVIRVKIDNIGGPKEVDWDRMVTMLVQRPRRR